MTTLLIGNEHEENVFISNYRDNINKQNLHKQDKHLLYDLQKEARNQFIKILSDNLIDKLSKKLNVSKDQSIDGHKPEKEFINLVIYTVNTYLDTVLYRYFFPFLSQKDICRIYNGLDFFIRSMKADKEPPFCLDNTNYSFLTKNLTVDPLSEIIKDIPKILKSTLESFRGLGALYDVTVEHSLEENHIPNYDNRRVSDINMIPNVNCFFI